MKRRARLLFMAAVAAPLLFSLQAVAGTAAQSTVKPVGSPSHTKPMHPDTLTLHPRGRPQSRDVSHRYTRHPFNPHTPINNTFVGPRM